MQSLVKFFLDQIYCMQIQAVDAVELQNIIFSRYRVLLYSHRHSGQVWY